ncbi:MAG: galactokinase [Spirochaetales bacterium]
MKDRDTPDSRDRIAERLAAVGLPAQSADRYRELVERFAREIEPAEPRELLLASAPGRTELSGNHTDHNLGRVLAASVNLDSIAVCRRRDDARIVVRSQGFEPVEVELPDPTPVRDEEGTSSALVRGVVEGFVRHGRAVGGFEAVASSRVLSGSGLSSSASFEVMIGALLNTLYNDGAVSATELAQIGKYAENVHFGKPSGLMDQVACATGGAVAIDFKDQQSPDITAVPLSFAEHGYSLAVVDTGGSHADLTDEYAGITTEMKAVANELGGSVLAEVDEAELFAHIAALRSSVGDRAVSRAIHFFEENRRVTEMVDAIRREDLSTYLRLMTASGHSSGLFLQNCAPTGSAHEQAVVTALALCERTFREVGLTTGVTAACRVHGGGFAGTIQLLVPTDSLDEISSRLASYLGSEAVTDLSIRNVGAIAFPLH